MKTFNLYSRFLAHMIENILLEIDGKLYINLKRKTGWVLSSQNENI